MEYLELEDRLKLIKKKLREANTNQIIGPSNQMITVHEIKLPINTLIFNPDNTRIRSDVLSFMGFSEENATALDMFYDNKENIDNQEFLYEKCLNAAGHNIKTDQNIYEHFDKVKKQQLPIIISKSGVVVDGNRRYASMLHLHNTKNDDGDYEFDLVSCQVLPEHEDLGFETERDLNRVVEGSLHLSQNLQLEHGYFEKALQVQYFIDTLSWSRKQLSNSLGYKSTQTVNDLYWFSKAVDEYILFRKKYDKNFSDYMNIYKAFNEEGIIQDLTAVGVLVKQAMSQEDEQTTKMAQIQLIFLLIFSDLKMKLEGKDPASDGRTYNLTSKSKKMLDIFKEIEKIPQGDSVKLAESLEKYGNSTHQKIDKLFIKIRDKMNEEQEDEDEEELRNTVISLLNDIVGMSSQLTGYSNSSKFIKSSAIDEAFELINLLTTSMDSVKNNLSSIKFDDEDE